MNLKALKKEAINNDLEYARKVIIKAIGVGQNQASLSISRPQQKEFIEKLGKDFICKPREKQSYILEISWDLEDK